MVVAEAGLEPASPQAPAPKAGVFTSFTTQPDHIRSTLAGMALQVRTFFNLAHSFKLKYVLMPEDALVTLPHKTL